MRQLYSSHIYLDSKTKAVIFNPILLEDYRSKVLQQSLIDDGVLVKKRAVYPHANLVFDI